MPQMIKRAPINDDWTRAPLPVQVQPQVSPEEELMRRVVAIKAGLSPAVPEVANPRIAQADALEKEATMPKPQPRGTGQELLYGAVQGLRGFAHPQGYVGMKQQDLANERTMTQDKLARVKAMREQANIEEDNARGRRQEDLSRTSAAIGMVKESDDERQRKVENLRADRPKFTTINAPGNAPTIFGTVNPVDASFTKTGETAAGTPTHTPTDAERELNDIYYPMVAQKYQTTVDKLTPTQKGEAAQLRANRGDNAPRDYKNVPIQTLNEKGEPVTKFVPPEGEYPLGPTAEMRNKANAKEFIGRAMSGLEGLGKKVITEKSTLLQAAKASGRSVDAVLTDDPDYKTYQASRFAMAANLAVAQQGGRPSDKDVESGWLPLIPNVFYDTPESASRKWEFIRLLIGQAPPETPAPVQDNSGGGLLGGPAVQELLRKRNGATGR